MARCHQLMFPTLQKVTMSVSQSRRSQYSVTNSSQTKKSTMTNMKEALEKCSVQDNLGGRGRKTWFIVIVTIDKNHNLKEISGADWCGHQLPVQRQDGEAQPQRPQYWARAADHHCQRQQDDHQECRHRQLPARDPHLPARGLRK